MESDTELRGNEPATLPGPAGDRELVSAILGGDRKATAELVLRYSDRIFSYIRQRMLPRTEFVEDLVQETFLIAWQGLSRYRGDASLESWIFGIARHRVEEHYRKRLRDSLEQLEPDDLPPAVAGLEPPWNREMDQERLRERTRRVLAQLPEAYSIALQWRYWENRSTREMAASTGKTEKSIERLLARARAEFRGRWNHD
ncbi:MAG: RNA polymerase sigma factor [Bryobacteraceae bacterium]